MQPRVAVGLHGLEAALAGAAEARHAAATSRGRVTSVTLLADARQCRPQPVRGPQLFQRSATDGQIFIKPIFQINSSAAHLFESFHTRRCLWGTWPAALYLSRMAATLPSTEQNSAPDTPQYFCSSDTKPMSAGAVSGWSEHVRWNSVHSSAKATSHGRNLNRKIMIKYDEEEKYG